MKKKINVTIPEVGSDAWLKAFKDALQCPTFKYLPRKEQEDPSWKFKGKKLANIRVAQAFQANFEF